MSLTLKAVLTFLLCCATSLAAEIKVITWNTSHAAPPAQLGTDMQDTLPFIQLGVSLLPEPKVMQLSFLGSSMLGLPADKALELHALLAERYKLIEVDGTFKDAPSALAYCFSTTKPTTGQASVYLPTRPDPESNVILFLHGYGGSFIFYQHYLASIFPDHIIICPAYGISSSHIPSAYIQQCLDATSKDLGITLKLPVLMGLSAGGFGGFREYARRPRSYAGYICLAAFPYQDEISDIPRKARIRLVAGAEEFFVTDGILQKAEVSLRRRAPDYESKLIPKQGHFFMLGDEDATKEILAKWNTELQTTH